MINKDRGRKGGVEHKGKTIVKTFHTLESRHNMHR